MIFLEFICGRVFFTGYCISKELWTKFRYGIENLIVDNQEKEKSADVFLWNGSFSFYNNKSDSLIFRLGMSSSLCGMMVFWKLSLCPFKKFTWHDKIQLLQQIQRKNLIRSSLDAGSTQKYSLSNNFKKLITTIMKTLKLTPATVLTMKL